ncbi:hypothetical protein L596_010437 [Steinernema carpocapsae]|uniref:Uncharacterized protein n=1 Tax=Steinernema carpocapsae TaxID=34508 RepID=A0A4U5PJ31_STECR|nr:hypothetical protein L596_010437 [Steinernema carpocapsae]
MSARRYRSPVYIVVTRRVLHRATQSWPTATRVSHRQRPERTASQLSFLSFRIERKQSSFDKLQRNTVLMDTGPVYSPSTTSILSLTIYHAEYSELVRSRKLSSVERT